MSIEHVIIHVVKRDNDGDNIYTKFRSTENSLKGMATQLTDGLIELFANANLSVGEFGVGGDNNIKPAFEQMLEHAYSTSNSSLCSDFVSLTKQLASHFQGIISKETLKSVKGGFLVFYQYKKNNNDWLAVAILNKTEGIDVDIDNDLDVVASEILDLKKLHLGATINLTQWKDTNNSRYIRFRAGLAAEIRDYFEEFIGCQRDKLAAQIETKKLKDAIKSFCEDECQYDSEIISQKVMQAHDFIKQQQKNEQEIKLSHIANHIFPDKSEDFSKYAKEHHELPEQLLIDNSALRRFKKISGRGKGVSISFDRDLLNVTVKYKNGNLIFTDLPETLQTAIEEDLRHQENDES